MSPANTGKKKKNAQLERITRYESIFDSISQQVKLLNEALDGLERLRPEIAELEAYYTGGEWKKDFADDEAGLLPPDLKRGVLSEDGVFDLLEQIKEISRE